MGFKVSVKDIPADTEYEPGFRFFQCVVDETTGAEEGAEVFVQFPPKSKSRVQYHENADIAFYCISGETIFYVGKDKKEYLIEADDFFYIPRGEAFNAVNPSETENAEGVMAFFGCSNPYKSGKVIVE